MSFHISAALRYNVIQRSTILLNLHALATESQTLHNESFLVTEGVSCEFFPLETGQNRYVRLETGNATELAINYSVDAETRPETREVSQVHEVPVADYDPRALAYLFPSRYCQSDRMGVFAYETFGHIEHPLEKASAINDWLYENVNYLSGSTDVNTSACDTIIERAGVCRDFAHLGISLCRALSIPARYFTGYACNMTPPDFHACFEACVGNQWFIFDPTRLSSLNGLVRIATGRDAADASVATIFGRVELQHMEISCTTENFQPLQRADLEGKAVLLEP